jgi:malate permease and related proteins
LADFQTLSRNQTSASQINFTRNAGDNFMNISILLMQQIVQLFLMIFMGYLIVKTGLVRDDDSKVLSKIILYLIVPCVIINAFQVDYTTDTVKGLLIAFAASVMTQVILLVVISVAGKLLHLNEVEVASVYYSNSGNLIVPIVTFILGQEWVLYGCVFMSVQLVFLWTHCKKIISREASYDWKKIILNINMISIFIGVILFFTGIRLPEIIGNTLASVGTMIGPASMIVTGMLFAGMNLKQIFANKRVYFITFLRLIVVPLIALVLIKLSNLASFSADGNKIMLIVFLAIITPSASTVTQMCQVYGNDSRYASAINVMTTLLSIITMPVMVMLFQMIM